MESIIWKDIEKMAEKNIAQLIFNSELSFDMQIHNIATDIYKANKVKMVLIAGPSASGKTTTCNMLAGRLEYMGVKVHHLSTDDFFLDRDDIAYLPSGLQDFDSINSLNTPLLQKTLVDILDNKIVSVPEYDFINGKCVLDRRTIEMTNHDIVIVEGIHAHNPIILSAMDNSIYENSIIKVYISPNRNYRMPNGEILEPSELRLLRRLIRDYCHRGHGIEKTLVQWKEVLNAEELYIKPYIPYANYIIDSSYEYELIVYKECIYDVIKKSALDRIQLLKRVLSQVVSRKIEKIPKTSLLNEFAYIIEEK